MNLFIISILFLLGASIGSFLSVVIYRVKHKIPGIFFGRSICIDTKKSLKPWHLIPILSYIFLRGKSPYSGKKISIHYLLLEISMGLLFVAAFLKWNFLTQTPTITDPSIILYSINWNILETFTYQTILLSFLMAIFFYDLFYKIIPDRFSLPTLAIALAAGLINGTPEILDMALGGILIFSFFALQFFLSKGKWIGGGDLRLGAVMGIILGAKLGLIALMLSYITGSVISIALLAGKKATRKTQIPFGPFLVTGTIVTMFFGNEILNWYLNIFTI
ncbi:hypothetical protein COU74_04100 [Candidatus Peregrinibacteria bacterium CG10_big_fil_rev_8_21_14_0_10_36_19]|nr:MAG: hypothetical protein COU74_04100 [Candidatus Peregrinibacteria bacterium CG10_big_fil_rev_8_21_14_0_10_36_19]